MDDSTMNSPTETESASETVPSEFAERADSGDLRTRLAILEAENQQLREEYVRAQQSTYRRTAVGLFVVGVVAILGGIAFPDARSVLFALGGTGAFAGVLTYVLTPERFVSARVGSRIFQALRADRDAIVDELGLGGDPVYVPGDDVRLFVPRYDAKPLPDESDVADLFVVPDASERGGVAFHPTGGPLFEEFENSRDGSLGTDLEAVAPAVTDAIVELFELADGVDYDIDTETSRITFELSRPGLGDPTSLDHPIPSFLAVSVVNALDTPVRVEVTDADSVSVTCRYGRPDVGQEIDQLN